MTDADNVSYGYRSVTASEKRRLVDQDFEAIAVRYDLADALLSFGLHLLWKRFAIGRLQLRKGERVLDLCGGTGDLAILAAREVMPGGSVAVCDINSAMMQVGRQKVSRLDLKDAVLWVRGDAESLSFRDEAFDAVTVGFGVRNLVNLERGLREILRILKIRGRLMILEFSVPKTGWIKRLYEAYSFKVMPPAGRLITGAGEPFKYLAESIRVFPAPEALSAKLEALGFKNVAFNRLTDGIAVVYLCTK